MARVVAKMKELGMAKVMVRGLNYRLALELLGFTVQTGPNNALTVKGKHARTAAARPKWKSAALRPQQNEPAAPAATVPRPRWASHALRPTASAPTVLGAANGGGLMSMIARSRANAGL